MLYVSHACAERSLWKQLLTVHRRHYGLHRQRGAVDECPAVRRVFFAYVFRMTLHYFLARSVVVLMAWLLVSIVSSYLSDRYNKRTLTIIFCSMLTTVGYCIFLGTSSFPPLRSVTRSLPPSTLLGTPHAHTRYASLFLIVPGTYATAPPLAALLSNLCPTHTWRATALALLTVSTNIGGVLSTWLLGDLAKPPAYEGAAWCFLGFGAAVAVVCAPLGWRGAAVRRRRRLRCEIFRSSSP